MIKKIHLWVPELTATKGGIQVFSGYLLRALRALPDLEITVFAKNDLQAPDSLGPVRYRTYGNGTSGAWRTVRFALDVYRSARKEQPDLVLTTHVNFAPLARRCAVPYWTVVHGIDAWELRGGSRHRGLWQSERILAVSSHTRRIIVENRPSHLSEHQALNQSVVFPNTFEPASFQPGPKPDYLRQRYGLPENDRVILTVTRLAGVERYKGYDQVLRALPEIIRAVPNVKYLIGGQGSDRPRLEALIRELNLEDRVILAGFIPDAELADHYNLCDLFAMPSKAEGFGIVFLEALACGKPVLAGNRDGSVDALNGGELGALVDPDNIEEIARTTVEILTGTYYNRLLYQPETLRARATELFGFEAFCGRLNQLVSGSARVPRVQKYFSQN